MGDFTQQMRTLLQEHTRDLHEFLTTWVVQQESMIIQGLQVYTTPTDHDSSKRTDECSGGIPTAPLAPRSSASSTTTGITAIPIATPDSARPTVSQGRTRSSWSLATGHAVGSFSSTGSTQLPRPMANSSEKSVKTVKINANDNSLRIETPISERGSGRVLMGHASAFQALKARHFATSPGTPTMTHQPSTCTAISRTGPAWQFRKACADYKLQDSRRRVARALGQSGSLIFDNQSGVQGIVSSHWFELAFCLAILSNSILQGYQVEYVAHNLTPGTTTGFYALGVSYGILFGGELVLRIWASGWQFFLGGPMWFWNYLDLLCMTCTVFEIAADTVYVVQKTRFDRSLASNVSVIRMLRVARFLRVIRIARVLRFLHALRIFLYSIIATLHTFIWALILLLMILYVFGILFTQTVSDYNIDNPEADSLNAHEQELLRRFWGTLPRSMCTLFQAISGGISWHECLFPLYVLGWLWVGAFIVFISFTYFAVLNVVTAIFCQSAIETAQNDDELLVQDQINHRELYVQRFKKLFKSMDYDESGAITLMELEENLQNPKVRAVFDALQVETHDAWALFKLLDPDESNEIDIDEFVMGLMRLRGSPKRTDILEIEVKISVLMKAMNEVKRCVERIVALNSDGSQTEKSTFDAKHSPHANGFDAARRLFLRSGSADSYLAANIQPENVILEIDV